MSDDDTNDGDENVLKESSIRDPLSHLLIHIKMAAQSFQLPILHLHTPIDIHVRAALYQIVDLVRFISFVREIANLYDVKNRFPCDTVPYLGGGDFLFLLGPRTIHKIVIPAA